MTRALHHVLVGQPLDDFAAGMRADGGVGDHAFRGARSCLGREPLVVQSHQKHAIEPRSTAHGAIDRIHRPRHRLRGADRQVVRCERLPIHVTFFDQKIARSGAKRGGVILREGQAGREAQSDSQPDPALHHHASSDAPFHDGPDYTDPDWVWERGAGSDG